MKRVLSLIICFAIALAASWNAFSHKEGWHVDETATLGLANGTLGGYITAYDDSLYGRGAFLKSKVFGNSPAETFSNIRDLISGFMDGSISASSIRQDYIASQKNGMPVVKSGVEIASYLLAYDGFTPYDVYINQITDAHPPLYYLFINAAYALYNAFGCKEVTFVPAWTVNMLFMLLCLFMLIRIGEKRFGSFTLGIAAAMFFAVCDAGITLGVYMRMYMALAFFALWSLDVHLSVLQKGRIDTCNAAALTVSCALGFLTHYYFAVWALAMAGWMFIADIRRRSMKVYRKYFLCMALGVLLTLIVWPFSLVHLLLSNRGYEAVAGLNDLSLRSIYDGFRIFITRLFGRQPWFGLASCAIMVFVILKRKQEWKDTLPILVPLFVYVLVIGIIEPYDDARYMACAYAPGILLAAWCIDAFLGCFKKIRLEKVCLITFSVILAASGYLSIEPDYLYTGTADTAGAIRAHSDMSAVYLSSGSSGFFRELPFLSGQKDTVILTMDEFYAYDMGEREEFLLYLNDAYSPTSALSSIEEKTGYVCTEIVAERNAGLDARVYVMGKKDE